jgi:magnesium chelatase subunit D
VTAEASPDAPATSFPPLTRQPPGEPPLDLLAPETVVPVGETFRARRLNTGLDRITRRASGRRSVTRTELKRGRYIRARPARQNENDIAFDATLRQAAPYQRRRQRQGVAFAVEPQDLQRKVRVRRAANLILFVVDASWSMAAAERMAATKGTVMSLLVDAYQRRDRVGLVTFRGQQADLVLPFTSNVERAQPLLAEIPVGGKTPLSRGLFLAYQYFVQALRQDPEAMPLMILLTDGAGNVSMTDLPPLVEARGIAETIKQRGIRSVVINMEPAQFDRGLAQELADALGGSCYSLEEMHSEALLRTVRQELGHG